MKITKDSIQPNKHIGSHTRESCGNCKQIFMCTLFCWLFPEKEDRIQKEKEQGTYKEKVSDQEKAARLAQN